MKKLNLYKLCANGCRDTFIIAEDIESSIKISGLESDFITLIKKVASEIVLDEKTSLLIQKKGGGVSE